MRRRNLVFAGALVTLAATFAATHCPEDPDCGHEGGECDTEVVCAYFPNLAAGDDFPCFGTGGGSGGGGGGGGTPSPTFPATVSPTHTSTPQPTVVPVVWGIAPYTFKKNWCAGILDAIDPINVVFVGNALEELVIYHSAHHGEWDWSGMNEFVYGTHQSFKQGSECHLMDGQVATGPSSQVPGRFHMRFYVDSGDPWPFDVIAVGAAHHEDLTFCGGVPKHVVDHNEDNGGVSGFDMGGEDIRDNWAGNGHDEVLYTFWGNSQRMEQCDGRLSWSDGWVSYITISD